MNEIAVAMFPSAEEMDAERRFQEASPDERRRLLSENVFPGSAGKKDIVIELQDGLTALAIFHRYEPACLKLWSVEEGVVRLPVPFLSDELQQCFRQDAWVALKNGVADLTEKAGGLLEEIEEGTQQRTAELQSLAESVSELEVVVEGIRARETAQAERLLELEEEVRALQWERDSLKRQLSER